VFIQGVQVARVDLVFENRTLISLLEQRGEAIKNERMDRVESIENTIEGKKGQFYNAKLVGAFITYESDQDIRIAQQIFGRKQSIRESFGESFDATLVRPVDPSNINWKNMHIFSLERFIRKLVVVAVILALGYGIEQMHVSMSQMRMDS